MFTLDANIFVRDVDIRDPHHAECHALLDALRLQRRPLICPYILLPEVAGAVRRTWQDAVRARLAAQFVGELPNLRLIAVDAELAQVAADLAADYALRGWMQSMSRWPGGTTVRWLHWTTIRTDALALLLVC